MKSLAPLLCAAACALLCYAAASAIPQPPPHAAGHKGQAKAPPVAQPPIQHKPAAAADAPLEHSDSAAFFDLCPQGPDWIHYKDHCYQFNETSEYWYVAEQRCIGYGGHLVSIADAAENSFVAKLTYCRSAWTGRYGRNADRLNDYRFYAWSDGTNATNYHAHDFSSLKNVHQPLISVQNNKWHNNVYHAKQHYVCKVPSRSGGGSASGCPAGWKHLSNSCYKMPEFTASYVEAMFHCNGHSAHLASVYNIQELRALSLLDLGSDGCPPELWIGLIKINPCRIDMFTGKPICYKWSDRKQDFNNTFPEWHPGHPNTGPVVNCVQLKDRAMETIECHERRRFVCKAALALTKP